MLLTNLIKNVLSKDGRPAQTSVAIGDQRPSVLNVGGNSKQIPIPEHYRGWNHQLLDIAPGPDVDVIRDARGLTSFDDRKFDAIYCSHNLEHYYAHDVPRVLSGFLHVLKPNGFAEIRVPNIAVVLRMVVEQNLELDDFLYTSPAGPITAHDVIYGWGKEIERSGEDFFAHKRGFSVKSLTSSLEQAGFANVWSLATTTGLEIKAIAFKTEPTFDQRKHLGF